MMKNRLIISDAPLIGSVNKQYALRLTAAEKDRADMGYKNVIAKLRNIFLKVAQQYNTSDYHIAVASSLEEAVEKLMEENKG